MILPYGGKSSMRYSKWWRIYAHRMLSEKWVSNIFLIVVSLKTKHGSDSEQPGFSGTQCNWQCHQA